MATPNMLLTLPVVGVTAGPTYATQVNAALTVIDQHDHSSGSGVQITPSGLNISSDLSFQSNDAVDLRTARFTAQSAALPGTTPDLACLYVVGDNLYYNDGSGNQIAMTASGSIAGAAGNITGLAAPASVVYTGGGAPNFKFMSTALASADLDAAQLILRNPTVTATYGLTLAAPTLSSNYSITLPVLPVATSFMTIDSSGTITNTIPIALGIDTANIAAGAVTAAKLATDSVTTVKIVDANVTPAKLSFDPAVAEVRAAVTATGTFVVPSGVSAITIQGIGGGGGGGGGGQNTPSNPTNGGGGGSSGLFGQATMAVVAGETLTITIGSGGSGGAGAASGAGSAGSPGNATTVAAGTTGWNLRFAGGLGGTPGAYLAATGGIGGAQYYQTGLGNSGGGDGGSGTLVSGNAGTRSMFAAAGTGGAGGPSGSGGGGGAAGILSGGNGGQGNSSVGGSAGANSGAGGGGGGASTSIAAGNGGSGGSGVVYISYVPVV